VCYFRSFYKNSTRILIKAKKQPGFISTLVAIVVISPLYMRNILKWNKSIYTLFSLILFLLLFSSLIELALGGKGFTGGIIQYLIIISVALSWLGMRAIAGVSWILLIGAVAFSIIENNVVMNFYGFVYIASGFIGLVLHSELGPAQLIEGIKEEFSISNRTLNQVKGDISQSVETIQTTI